MALTRQALIPYCTARVSTTMARLGANAPRTRYLSRTAMRLASDYEVESGIVKTLCSFLTGSGFEREIEVPVVIHGGEILDPTVAWVNGRLAALNRDLIQGISNAGLITHQPLPGTMYTTAYCSDPKLYREIREATPHQTKLYRPMY